MSSSQFVSGRYGTGTVDADSHPCLGKGPSRKAVQYMKPISQASLLQEVKSLSGVSRNWLLGCFILCERTVLEWNKIWPTVNDIKGQNIIVSLPSSILPGDLSCGTFSLKRLLQI